MPLYAIILDKPDEDMWENVRATWPKHFVSDERIAFINTEDVLTAEITQKAGITAGGTSGIVIQMNFFSGRGSNSLAEWITKNSE